MGRLKIIWTDVQSSLWFVPALLVLFSGMLAFGLIEIDFRFTGKWQERFPRMFGVSAEGARGLLSAIAGSMVTIAGVSFSITLVALSLAATQYTSRVLRNFMRDRVNQSTLGILVGIFVYCLVVLRTIRSGEDGMVPALATAAAIIFAIGGIGMFIWFLHHIVSAIQASSVLHAITKETINSLENLFRVTKEHGGDGPERSGVENPPGDGRKWHPILSEQSGFIQTADLSSLKSCAEQHDIIVRMEQPVGDFVVEGTPLAFVLRSEPPDPRLVRTLNRAIGINSYRSIEQDPAFGIRQIVDIAIKALSPGINDQTTAASCVQYLGALLHKLLRGTIPAPERHCNGKLRLVVREPSFECLVDLMFDEIRQNARGNVPVITAMLSVIDRVSRESEDSQRLEVLRKHRKLIMEDADETVCNSHDLELLRARFI